MRRLKEITTRWQTNVRTTEHGPSDCMNCDGTGYLPGEGTCWTCDGTGVNPNASCEECGETGEDCTCQKSETPMGEGVSFDKFMDRILLKETRKVPAGDSPLRERAHRHQERPLGRIRFQRPR